MAPVRRMRSRRTKRRNVRRRYTKRRVGGKPSLFKSRKGSPDLSESLRPKSDMTDRSPSPELTELAQRTMEVGALEAKVRELDETNMGMARVIKSQSAVIEQQKKLIEGLKTKVSSLETELSSLKKQRDDDEFADYLGDDDEKHLTDVTDPIV